MSSHSWERGLADTHETKRARHSWEHAGAPATPDPDRESDPDDSDEEDVEDEEVSQPLSPGEEYVEHMLGMYLDRTLTAGAFCVTMWRAAKAGIAEA
jgi:hypothetical protein